ncbi:hypothetical protein A9958_07765 [Staphylococcus simulans]|uniref:hypothetical protein n=1 Tax=Staphylococcus simulans TaxID=1286 RepID=UPI000D09EFA5|nr:hypothetical protein [Staphylococcus simulans]AVO02300.1 hypothetical protein BI282_07755 [Staphylococcus simulans]AVO05246.1 hypothetical protein BI283_07720 [Staphylococcus simulans]AWG18849.1 hypothetical protein A9958_07765 [Staphylococcus simulans]AWI01796.1 hypothetical protein A7X73_07650 [Staphylococcus simulans]
MISRHILDGFFDRKNVNGINRNFDFIFGYVESLLTDLNDVSNRLTTKSDMDDINFNFIFENLNKVMSLSDDAENILKKAEHVNSENINVQQQLNQMIIDEGTSDAEVVQARVDAKGIASDTLKQRIDKLENSVEDSAQKSVLYEKIYNTYSKYAIPNDLKIAVPFNVSTSASGNTSFDYDVSVNKNPVTKTYYVDVKKGDNSNPGTESLPFKSINRALRYGDADEILVNEGVYGWADGFGGFTQNKPFNLIGKGKVLIGAHRDGLLWNQNTTYSNVYQTNASSVTEVVDYNNINDIKFLEKVNSVEAVSQKAGAYYIDSSNNIYVRTHDSRVPDDQILPNMFNDAVKITDNAKVYFENIRFTNSVKLIATTAGKNFFAKDCYFSIGSGGNALSIEGYDFNIIQRCVAKHATMDGFNYHIKNGVLPKVIEIDCKGYDNGRNGADQNNGSTMHDGGHIMRINGEYYNNGGPNVIDVNEGTVSVNIGVHSHHSRASKGTISNASFKNGNLGASKMHLINCVSNGSDYSIVTASSESSVTAVENSLLIEPRTEV